MNKLIEQIPKPHLLLGDLNSHSTVWGYQKTNKDLEKVISTNDLCGSDHFPIILKSLQPLHEDRLPHWK